jgi:hypothetical protein
MLPFPWLANDFKAAIAEKSLVNDVGVSEADPEPDVVAEDPIVVLVVLLLVPLLHEASISPPATAATTPMVRLLANCPPVGI